LKFTFTIKLYQFYSVSVSGPITRMTGSAMEESRKHVVAAAHAISEILGFTPKE